MSPTGSILDFSGRRLQPLKNPESARMEGINLVEGTYEMGTLVGEFDGVAEKQTLTITGTPTGGTFKLTYATVETAAIAFNANAAAVASALNLIAPIIAAGGVSATGGALPGTPVVITFLNRGARTAITFTSNALTGGTAPNGSLSETRAGVDGTAGLFGAYDSTHVDGTEVPKFILAYDVEVDADGNAAIGDTNPGEWGLTHVGVPAYRSGYFDTSELVGLDANAVSILGRLVHGDVSDGALMVIA